MAVEVEMNDDIRKYEPKTFGPFTTRQTVCTSIALLYSIPIGIWAPFAIENKLLLIIIVALPVAMAGWIKMDGCKAESFILRVIYWKILAPGRRRYKCKNSFREALEKMNASKEKKMMARMTPAERKKYEQNKANKVVKYSRKREYKVYK